MPWQVELTETGYRTLEQLSDYLRNYVTSTTELSPATQLLDFCAERLTDNPFQFPVSHELELLGFSAYRSMYVDNFKIIFRADEQRQTCYLLAFLRQNQSTEKALYHVLISYPV